MRSGAILLSCDGGSCYGLKTMLPRRSLSCVTKIAKIHLINFAVFVAGPKIPVVHDSRNYSTGMALARLGVEQFAG